jgi:tRNA(Ile)-lysidine synthase
VSAADIRVWLRSRGIACIDDPSNADEGLTRNLIRARVMPALQTGFPSFLDTFGRTARHAAQAQALLEERAADDLAVVGLPPAITGLRTLGADRLANLLRHWLRRHCGTSASTAQLDELVKQVLACTTRGHGIELKVGHGLVCRRGPALVWSEAGVHR